MWRLQNPLLQLSERLIFLCLAAATSLNPCVAGMSQELQYDEEAEELGVVEQMPEVWETPLKRLPPPLKMLPAAAAVIAVLLLIIKCMRKTKPQEAEQRGSQAPTQPGDPEGLSGLVSDDITSRLKALKKHFRGGRNKGFS